MTLKQLIKKRDLAKEEFEFLNEKVKRLTLEGYRAIFYGDEYSYGGWADYMFSKGVSRKEVKESAERAVACAPNGGHLEELYPDTPGPGRIS